MERFPLFRILLVASAVAGIFFLYDVSTKADQRGDTQLEVYESFPTLIGGAFAGGAVGGVIACWLLLKLDPELDYKFNNINKKLDNHAKELKEITKEIVPCVNKMNSGLSQSIIDATTQIESQIEGREQR